MPNAGPSGAIAVEDAESAPPAASWMGVPPAAPDPMNDPTTATTALTATTILQALLPAVPAMSAPFVSMLMTGTVRRFPASGCVRWGT